MSSALPDASPELQATTASSSRIVSKIRHHLLFRDTVTFLTLTAFTALLFFATLLLFRSFAAHQLELAHRWSERGRTDLTNGRPEQAVTSLRTALTYAPGERSYELMLAEALGDAGHTEEAYTYFSGLWDRTPGDGLINLWLARLSAKNRESAGAINFYRAAIYGTWPGDAIVRRQQVRLELAQYLIAQKQLASAREELLIAGSNAGHNPDLDLRISELLVTAGDPHEALDYDLKVLADKPTDTQTAVAAAKLSNQLGNPVQTLRLTDRALHLLNAAKPETAVTTASIAEMHTLRSDLERLQALAAPDSLSSAERARRLLSDATIARQRLAGCLVATGATTASAPLSSLSAQWGALQPTLNPRSLTRDHDAQDTLLRLIDNTEEQARSACGQPTGDDALLLRLAQQHADAAAAMSQPSQP